MRRLAALALLTFASLSPAVATAAEGPANLLLNPGAESGKDDLPSVWFAATGPRPTKGLRMTRSTAEAHAGKASLEIRSEAPEGDAPTSFNWAQGLTSVPSGKTVRLSAWIKTADADAANVCLQCWSIDDKLLAFASTPVFRGDQEWVEARGGPVRVPDRTETAIVRAALTGRGRAWFDDIAVVVVDPANEPAEPAEPPQKPDASKAKTAAVDKALAKVVEGTIVRAMPIEEDCTVLSYLPDWNHGRVDWIAVANNSNGAEGGVRTLVKLPSVEAKEADPADRKFLLALYSGETTAGEGPSQIEVFELKTDLRPETSWKTMPKAFGEPASSVAFGEEDGWKLFDVTAMVRKWAKASKAGPGVMLRFAKEDVGQGGKWSGYQFVSSEGRANRRPLLLIVDPAK